MASITIRVDDETAEKLKHNAKASNQTLSEFLRTTVEIGMEFDRKLLARLTIMVETLKSLNIWDATEGTVVRSIVADWIGQADGLMAEGDVFDTAVFAADDGTPTNPEEVYKRAFHSTRIRQKMLAAKREREEKGE